MKRTCAQKYHDLKCDKVLGMRTMTAKSQLQRQIILHAYRQLGMGNCFQCGFPIETYLDMSIEHKQSWAGNEAKNIPSNADLFWDINNIALSHKWCNCVAGVGGSGESGYLGVHVYIDKRHEPHAKYMRAMIRSDISASSISLGCYKISEEAAIAYDLAAIVEREGCTKLNFEYLREEYNKEIKARNLDKKTFYSIRNGPIKQLVGKLYKLLLKMPNF